MVLKKKKRLIVIKLFNLFKSLFRSKTLTDFDYLNKCTKYIMIFNERMTVNQCPIKTLKNAFKTPKKEYKKM